MKSEPRMVISRLAALAVSSAFVLFFTQPGIPQQNIDAPRVGFEFRCPNYGIACCQAMALEADVFGAKEIFGEEVAKSIAYRWEVSGGTIIAGQGTSKVTIGAGECPSSKVGSVTVKINLAGGPPELEREKACTLKVDRSCSPPTLFDQYQNISLTNEEDQLDRLAHHLTTENARSVSFIVVYAGETSCLWEARWRATRAKKYLVDRHNIEASRVIAVDGGFREKLTVDVFISPRDSCGPFPSPTLVGSKASINGSCTDKYNMAGREEVYYSESLRASRYENPL